MNNSTSDNNTSTLLAQLQKATQDLLFQSESDYPIEPMIVEGSGRELLAVQDILQIKNLPADSSVKEMTIDEFFVNAITIQEWHEPEQRGVVERFQSLVEILKENLSDIRVYKIGDIEFDVYVIGRTASGGFAGVSTRVVET